MRKKIDLLWIFTLALGFLLLTNACSRKGSRNIDPEFARYIAAFTSGSVSSGSSILIELNQDIPTVELNAEVNQDLFEFSPKIKGKAYWVNARTIKFVPEPGELKSGTTYDAWFKLDKVLQVEKDFDEFYFYFKIPEQNFAVDVLPYSPTKDNDLTWNTVKGSLLLADEAPITDIEKMLSVEGNSNTAVVKVEATDVRARYAFTIDSLKRTTQNLTYTLKVDGSPIGANREAEKLSLAIPAINTSTFSVVDVRTVYEPSECIRITFSDPLSNNQNIQGLINPNGIENYSYEIQKNVLKLYIDAGNNSNTSINLSIFKELKSSENKRLDKNYDFQLSLEKNKPEIKLLNSGNILPSSENLTIPFEAVNLWAVDITIVKIFENNILGYLQSNDFGGDYELRRFGRLVLKKQIRLDGDHTKRLDVWNNFSINLATLIEQDPGAIYRVKLTMKKEYSLYPCGGIIPQIPQADGLERFDNRMSEDDEAIWDIPQTYYYDPIDWDDYDWSDRENPCTSSYYSNRSSDCIVFASNVGLVAKIGSNKQVMVAVTDILTTKPLTGANIDVYNFQMQRIGSGKTDGNGFATINYKGGVPFVVVASNDKEKGYLKLTSNLSLSLSNFDVSGKEIQKGLKGYIYGERGVWRPGDSIYLTFILDDKVNPLPKGHPISLELFTPTGQIYQKHINTSGKDGFYTFKLATDPSAITGNWRAVIKVGGATFSKTIRIETVKPNRLKVRLNVGELINASRGVFHSSLSAQWLQGAVASNLKANVEMTLSVAGNPFKGYEAYSFNNPASNFISDTYTLFDGRLDANGNVSIEAPLPPASNAPGMLKASLVSRVFETGGDASIYSQVAAYSPYSSYVGIKSSAENDYQMLETGKDNMLDIVTLSPEGKAVNQANVNVKIYKINWSWWWNRNDDDLSSYVNNTSANIVVNEDISTTGGKGKVEFNFEDAEWGRYLVMATDKQSGHIAGKIIYVDWPAWKGRSNKEDASGLTMLSFSTDKKTPYNVGEKVTVTIPKSSDGRVLISIEDGTKVLQSYWATTSAKEDTQYTFEVTEEMNPNFFIFATLLQPYAQTDNDLPIRLYGVLNIKVENKNTILTPVITMPDELRPEKEFTVSVSEQNKKAMTYTLAVVDEGLLDLTAFKTPNAWTDFYAYQALGVRTWDMFNMVVGAQTGKMGTLLSIGGDETLKPSSNPVNRFKPVVKFLGPFTLKKGGTQSHKIKLDPYIGSVRVMVVAGSPDGAYGSAEKTVMVKNPLMVLATLPRVAGPDEEILLPVNVFAMDKKVKTVNVTVQAANGLFTFVDGTSKSVTFTETGDKVVYFKVKVAKKTGAEKVTVKASGGGEISNETIDIEVRNPNPPIVLTSDALVVAGQSNELGIKLDSPTSDDWIRLEISRMPAVDLSKNMAYLHDYPYGCSEQVTSRVFPLLYVGAFKKFSEKETEKMKYNINEGIKILSSRQLGDGGIVYWPGSSYPTEWVTSYAGHFLIEAKNKGYNVPESVIGKWKQFQKKAAQRWNRRDLYNSYYSYSMSDLQQAYRLYTLALAGDPELGAMNRLKEMKDLSTQARWRLAGAYVLAGKKDAAQQIISNVPVVIDKYSAFNNTYGSAARDIAMVMETNLLLGRIEKALALAPEVSAELSAPYISTQTAAYGLIAMSQLAEKMGKGLIAYDWSLNGTPQKTEKSALIFQEYTIKPQEAVNINFTNKGEGQLYVRLIGQTRPLVDTSPPLSDGINVYLKYVDDNNREIDVTSLQQGTEFFANVIVQNVSGEFISDLALTQIFASGWEIFNNRLFNAVADTGTSSFNYQDIRDDRVMTFFNLGSGYSTVVKIRLQAAYCGRFYLPAISCEAMYKPQLQARTSGMWVEVKQ